MITIFLHECAHRTKDDITCLGRELRVTIVHAVFKLNGKFERFVLVEFLMLSSNQNEFRALLRVHGTDLTTDGEKAGDHLRSGLLAADAG